ncbi:MAG: hypothetical protein LLG20_22715 [Acidobacteriales bacterium]|nr:hypothetical protein [Terriglobales bacterium]
MNTDMFFRLSDLDCNCEPPTSSYQERQYFLLSVGEAGLDESGAILFQFRTLRWWFIFPQWLRFGAARGKIPIVHIALLPCSRLRKQQKARRREIARSERDRESRSGATNAPSEASQKAERQVDRPAGEEAPQQHPSLNPALGSFPTPGPDCQTTKDDSRTRNAPRNPQKCAPSPQVPCGDSAEKPEANQPQPAHLGDGV